MNKLLIEKVIKSNDSSSCPELTYENPLIERNTAAALACSFVKILSISQQSSNLNKNLRHSVISNIRNLCRIEPDNHLEVEEDFTNALAGVYINHIQDSRTLVFQKFIETSLDEFLLRKMKDVDINSLKKTSMNPEVLQALMNLTDDKSKLESLAEDVLHWNITNKKNVTLIKSLWTNSSLTYSHVNNICNDISIKMKPEIEITILNICFSVVTDPNLLVDDLFLSNNDLKHLVMKCSMSAVCFQICCGILSHLFVHTNYNQDIQIFISKFIQNVKNIGCNSISVLYPAHLRPVIVLLDIDLDVLPSRFKDRYIKQTLVHLKNLHVKAEIDLVSVLSHFPDWLDYYPT